MKGFSLNHTSFLSDNIKIAETPILNSKLASYDINHDLKYHGMVLFFSSLGISRKDAASRWFCG